MSAYDLYNDDSSQVSRVHRKQAGASHRAEVPLESHASVPDPVERPDPITILSAQDETRLTSLVPIRHGRMGATAFTFYRGGAAIMASDLSSVPSTGIAAQLCGDAHLANFGLFNGPDRRLVFDVNDFDETLPGPFEWDVKRLAASVTIAARNNDISTKKADAATRSAVRGYRKTIARLSLIDPLSLHSLRLDIETIQHMMDDAKSSKRVRQARKKASGKNSLRAFNKLTEVVDGTPRIKDDPPLIRSLDTADLEEFAQIQEFFGRYHDTLPLARRRVLERYRFVDMAHKIVGVGSVGTRCLIILLLSGDDEPLFIQFKEASASVLEPYLGKSKFEQAGERVVQGQRLMQATGDVFLGWARYAHTGRKTSDFYFRQLWDGKGSAEIDEMGPNRLARYAKACGSTLALAHARSGDAATISGYLGDDKTFDYALADFAHDYAEINAADHAAHVDAIAEGRIDAIHDI